MMQATFARLVFIAQILILQHFFPSAEVEDFVKQEIKRVYPSHKSVACSF